METIQGYKGNWYNGERIAMLHKKDSILPKKSKGEDKMEDKNNNLGIKVSMSLDATEGQEKLIGEFKKAYYRLPDHIDVKVGLDDSSRRSGGSRIKFDIKQFLLQDLLDKRKEEKNITETTAEEKIMNEVNRLSNLTVDVVAVVDNKPVIRFQTDYGYEEFIVNGNELEEK